MSKSQIEKCVWIGIGIDVGNTPIYNSLKKMNKWLISRHKNLLPFTINNRPHINLYDLSIPEKNINSVIKEIQKIVLHQKKFSISTDQPTHFLFGTFFLKLLLNKGLFGLHSDIVKKIVGLRGNCIDEDYLTLWKKYSKQEKMLLVKYGNPHVLKNFFPHITLGFIKDLKEGEMLKIDGELQKFIKRTEIVIDNVYVVVGNGKKKKIIASFPFIK